MIVEPPTISSAPLVTPAWKAMNTIHAVIENAFDHVSDPIQQTDEYCRELADLLCIGPDSPFPELRNLSDADFYTIIYATVEDHFELELAMQHAQVQDNPIPDLDLSMFD